MTIVTQQKRRSQRGFTLLELLVVIAIIGILASITILSLSRARQKARDAKRLADITQLQQVLELYYADNNEQYPRSSRMLACAFDIEGEPTSPGNQCEISDMGNWIPGLVPTYSNSLPSDPREYPNYEPYRYFRSDTYGYILTFKLEALPKQNHCRVQSTIGQTLSSRCGKGG